MNRPIGSILMIIAQLHNIMESLSTCCFCSSAANRRMINIMMGISVLIFSCQMHMCSYVYAAVCQATEGFALLDLKKALIDDSDALREWNVDTMDVTYEGCHHYCSWRGVTCDNITFSVVALNLSGLSLQGEISSSLGLLKNLRIIDLSHNSISGLIPNEIVACEGLQHVDLSHNSLNGGIPFSISKLKELERLILKNNRISGPIPSTLSQIPNLKVLDLAQNQLSGEVPGLIYWSEVLQYLGLRNNLLSGELSPDMCSLTALWYFDVRNNNLSGIIPPTIGNCTSFEILDLAFNRLSGEIPYNIGFLQVATLSLQGNKLTGEIPNVIGLMQALAVLDLSYNDLHGPVPSIIGNLTYTGKLYLQGNNLTGPIPRELGNMSKLSYLQLNDNYLSGEIPSELGKLEYLFELNLANNLLHGPIPENLSSCISLNYLNGHGNGFTGRLPEKLQQIISLTYLNFSFNLIQGNIPAEIGHIRNLDTLDLSHNGIEGSIPRSIGDLEHLLILNLSTNKITGFIPSELGNLRILSKLDISSNALQGNIPSEFGQLQNLDSLYLNNNNLSGGIPHELVNCISLTALNLSYNNFSGDVPIFRNFSSFPLQSYIGNSLLCGNLVGVVCNMRSIPDGTRSSVLIVGLVVGPIALLALSVWIWKYGYQREWFNNKLSSMVFQGDPKVVILHTDLALQSYHEIISLTENFNTKYVIGYGASSIVYKCILKTGKPVALKKLYSQHLRNLQEFENELQTMGRIRHRNLVSLQGYCLSRHSKILFYDYMVNGDLWDLLHGSSTDVKLDWNLRIRIALGAAQGLAYLHHDCNPRIVHRDVKTANILLDGEFESHLSDFGIAKCLSRTKGYTSTSVEGTIGYIDPEYARTSRLNEKSDVYSFGIVLLELITGRKPVNEEINLHQWVLLKRESGTVVDAIDATVKSTCGNLSSVMKWLQLALLCSNKSPSLRPTMRAVVRVLLSLLPKADPKATIQEYGSNRRYIDHYADSKHREVITGTSSTSGENLFDEFGELISQNTMVNA